MVEEGIVTDVPTEEHHSVAPVDDNTVPLMDHQSSENAVVSNDEVPRESSQDLPEAVETHVESSLSSSTFLIPTEEIPNTQNHDQEEHQNNVIDTVPIIVPMIEEMNHNHDTIKDVSDGFFPSPAVMGEVPDDDSSPSVIPHHPHHQHDDSSNVVISSEDTVSVIPRSSEIVQDHMEGHNNDTVMAEINHHHHHQGTDEHQPSIVPSSFSVVVDPVETTTGGVENYSQPSESEPIHQVSVPETEQSSVPEPYHDNVPVLHEHIVESVSENTHTTAATVVHVPSLPVAKDDTVADMVPTEVSSASSSSSDQPLDQLSPVPMNHHEEPPVHHSSSIESTDVALSTNVHDVVPVEEQQISVPVVDEHVPVLPEEPMMDYPAPVAIAVPENEEAATLFPTPPIVDPLPAENVTNYAEDFDTTVAAEHKESISEVENTGFQEEEVVDTFHNHAPPSSSSEEQPFVEEEVPDENNKSTYDDDFEQHPPSSSSISSPPKTSKTHASPKVSSSATKPTKSTTSPRRSVSPTHKSPRRSVSPTPAKPSVDHPLSPSHPPHEQGGEPSSAFVERRTQATAAYQAWVSKKEQQEKAEKEKKLKEEQHLRELIAASDARKAESIAERRKKRGAGIQPVESHPPPTRTDADKAAQAIAKRIEANPLQRKKLPEKLLPRATNAPSSTNPVNPTDPNVVPPVTATPIYYNPYTAAPFLPFGMLPIAVDPSNTTNGVPNVTLDLQQLQTLLPPGYIPFSTPAPPTSSQSATSPRTIKAGMDAVSTHHNERRRRSVSRPTPLNTTNPNQITQQPQPILGMDPRLFPEGLPPTMLIPPNLMFPMGYNGLPMYPGLSFPPSGNDTLNANTKEASKLRTPRTAPAKGRRSSPNHSTGKNVFELNGLLEDGDDAFVNNPKSSKRKSKPSWDNHFASAGSLSGGVQGTVLDEDLAMSTLRQANSVRRGQSPNNNSSDEEEQDEEGKPKLLPVGSGTRVTSKRPQYDVLLDRVSLVDTLKQVVDPETAADILSGKDTGAVRAMTTSPRSRLSSPLRNNVSSSGKRTGSRGTSRARTSEQKNRPRTVNHFQNDVLQVATNFANAGNRIEKQNIARAAAESAVPFDVSTPVRHSGSIVASSQRAQSPKEMVERALAAAQAATARSMQSALLMQSSPTPLGLSMSPANGMGNPYLPMVPLSPTAQALLAGGMLSQNLAQAINAALSPKMGTSANNPPVSETNPSVTSPTAQLRGASVVDSGLHPTSPPPVMDESGSGTHGYGSNNGTTDDRSTHHDGSIDGSNPPLVKPTPVRKASFVPSDDSTNALLHSGSNENNNISVTVYPTITEETGTHYPTDTVPTDTETTEVPFEIPEQQPVEHTEERVYHIPTHGSEDHVPSHIPTHGSEDHIPSTVTENVEETTGTEVNQSEALSPEEQPTYSTEVEPTETVAIIESASEDQGISQETTESTEHALPSSEPLPETTVTISEGTTEHGYALHVASVEQGDSDHTHSSVVVTPSRKLPQPEIIDENGNPVSSVSNQSNLEPVPSVDVEAVMDHSIVDPNASESIANSSASSPVQNTGSHPRTAGTHSPRNHVTSSPRHHHIVIPPKPSPPLPPSVEAPPFDDADIFAVHRKQLEEFAHAHAPQMLQTLDTAWDKFGSSLEGVGKLWDACERRYPNLTLEFRVIAIEVEASRTAARETWTLYASQLQMYEEALAQYEAAIKAKENADFNRMMEQAKNDGGPLYLPRWDTVYATLVSSYVEPPAVLVDNNGQVIGSAPPEGETIPEGTMVLALTPGTPSILSLSSAVRRLLDLSPRDIALLQYVRKPNRSLVVAYGALCVLLDIPTTWPDALRVISDELLVDKLVYLSGLPLMEGRTISSMEPQAFAMQVAAADGQNYTKQHISMSPGGVNTHVTTHTSNSPVTSRPRGVPASLNAYSLQATGKQISLARKLLNKRPDIRAEVRHMAVSVVARPLPPHHGNPTIPPSQFSGPPFTMACNALVALVEWLCAYTLHHTEAQIQADPQTRELWQSQLNARSTRSSTRPSGAQSTELGLSSASSFPDGK